jgi:hypothetical protein
MTSITVNKEHTKAHYDMCFHFPSGWQAERYDAHKSFYREKFEPIAGSKAVDIVAINPTDRELWLIEAKDYRAFPRKDKGATIIDIIAKKVIDTLAGILTAACSGKSFYQHAIKQNRIRVVFHLEQPVKPSKLYPQLIDWANGTRKLEQKLRVIDPHPILCSMNMSMNKIPWTVTETRRPKTTRRP